MSSWGLYNKVSKGYKKSGDGLYDDHEANDQIQGGPPPRPTDCGIGGCARPPSIVGANGHGVRKMVGMNGHGIRLTPDQIRQKIMSKYIQLKK